jgi:formate hydrogenlyase transcriptional activator
VTRDFTDRKRAEEAVMLQLSNALLSNLDVSKLMSAISASIHEVIPHDTSALALFDHATGDMVVQFMGPYDADVFPGDARVPVDGTVAGQVFRTGEPFLMQRLSDISFAPETVRILSRLGMNAGCWVPLKHHGSIDRNVMGILSRLEGSIDAQSAEILSQVACR